MKFVLLFAVALFCQGLKPCEGGKLFSFFHNSLARRAMAFMDKFRHRETECQSFHSFFRDLLDTHLYAKGHIRWNETRTDPPLTTPEIITPLSELNYWRSVSSFLNFFCFIWISSLMFFGKCFLVLKFGRKITGLVKAAAEKYPADPLVVPVTIGELQSLEETLVWQWVCSLKQYMFMVVVYLFNFSYDLFFFFPFCSKYVSELQKMTNTVVGHFVTVD